MRPPVLHLRNSATLYGAVLLAVLIFFLATASMSRASTTVGTIDPAHTFAFSNIGGYVNFGIASGGVTVTDGGLSGYAWSANDGWINLSPSQGGVKNNGNGVLSGSAWDETAGWVDFTGVTIDSSGLFRGLATGGTVQGASYAINFDCTFCGVVTDWRSIASRTSAVPISPTVIPPQSPVGGGGIFAGPVSSLPGFVTPRLQTIFPDGHIVFLDTGTTIPPPTGATTPTLPLSPTAFSALVSTITTQNHRVNDTGPGVLALQKLLNALGFTLASSGPGSPGEETSFFGSRTFRALVRFQAAHGLPATGFLGPLTRGVIAGL